MRVSSTQAQNNFGKYLKFAEANEEIIVTKQGKAVAKIIKYREHDDTEIKEEAAKYSTENRVTYEEYLELVNTSEQRFELIDGVIYNLASPVYQHQHAVGQLFAIFHNWLTGKSCVPLTSPFDVTFRKTNDNICVVQPDLMILCDPHNIDEGGKYQGIPTLTVEVLSPSTRSKDLLIKLELFKQCGVQEYWIVDPINEQITIYELNNNEISNNRTYTRNAGEDAQSFCFTGLRARLQDVFV